MAKKHVFRLSAEERAIVREVADSRQAARWKVQRAQVLLLAEAAPDGPAWTDSRIAEAHRISIRCLESWRKKAVEAGPLALLERSSGPVRTKRIFDGEKEARLVALACSEAPPGRVRWTLKLLSSRLVELQVVESVSPETVRKALKKTT